MQRLEGALPGSAISPLINSFDFLATTGGLSAGQLAQAAAMVVVTQTRNYFKSVSENKEITKIISLLSTAINSTKKEVTTGQFSLTQGQQCQVGQ